MLWDPDYICCVRASPWVLQYHGKGPRPGQSRQRSHIGDAEAASGNGDVWPRGGEKASAHTKSLCASRRNPGRQQTREPGWVHLFMDIVEAEGIGHTAALDQHADFVIGYQPTSRTFERPRSVLAFRHATITSFRWGGQNQTWGQANTVRVGYARSEFFK